MSFGRVAGPQVSLPRTQSSPVPLPVAWKRVKFQVPGAVRATVSRGPEPSAASPASHTSPLSRGAPGMPRAAASRATSAEVTSPDAAKAGAVAGASGSFTSAR